MQAVLGGGISGLSAGYYLKHCSSSAKVLLLEGGGRVGGWVSTSKQKNGLLFEQGPRTIRPRFEAGLNTLKLVEELGIAYLVRGIPSNHPTAKNRMIFVGGKLHSLPSSISQAFIRKPPFSQPLVASFLHDLRAARKTVDDESIYSFVERRLGHELAEYAISPMICGICAGDAKKISVKFLMRSLFELEQQYGSICKGLFSRAWENRGKLWSNPAPKESSVGLVAKAKKENWSVWSLEGGLEVLPQTLLSKIQSQGVQVHLNAECSQIHFNEKGASLTVNGENIQVKSVLSTISAKRLAPLLVAQHPFLHEELSKIPCVSVAVVNLAFEGNVLNQNAFGFLIPPSENKPILGVIFDTCSFPQSNFTVLTVMMGGHWFESRLGSSPSKESILNTALTHVRSILQIKESPCNHQVSVLKDCIPQYLVGHYERVDKIRDYILKQKLPLHLVGSSYDGVGVNDVIFSAKKSVQEALKNSA